MAEFIQTEEFKVAGEEGERQVFEAAKAAFAGRDILGFWCYPLVTETNVGESDILLLDTDHAEFGVEVKSLPPQSDSGVERVPPDHHP